MEGSAHDPSDILCQHFSWGTEKNHKNLVLRAGALFEFRNLARLNTGLRRHVHTNPIGYNYHLKRTITVDPYNNNVNNNSQKNGSFRNPFLLKSVSSGLTFLSNTISWYYSKLDFVASALLGNVSFSVVLCSII